MRYPVMTTVTRGLTGVYWYRNSYGRLCKVRKPVVRGKKRLGA